MFANTSNIEKVLQDPKWPDQFPYDDDDFQRLDTSPDTLFYEAPRFVKHIDDGAINALTRFYSTVFPKGPCPDVAILDLCSSWISHYPADFKAGRVVGLGMNQEELEANPVVTEAVVRDLNADPRLPFPDNTFDFVTNAVSVDYLAQPLQVFKEIHRVLKPGGLAINSFSNRCFPTKVISIWTRTLDPDHIYIVGSYFHYSVPGGFDPAVAKDISPGRRRGLFGGGDPMYVVYARKAQPAAEA